MLIGGSAFGQQQAQQTAEDNPGTTIVLGCIQRSTQDYTIVDSHGSTYLLAGVGNQLDREVGHTLQVRGTIVKEPTNLGIASKGSLQVQSVAADVHRVADRCASR
jgi:hypothetical protein